MDVKSEEFCTVLFGRLMSQADRRYPFKLANFRQRLSLVVARAVARQALSYMQSGACVAYEVSNDDLFIHEPFLEDAQVDSESDGESEGESRASHRVSRYGFFRVGAHPVRTGCPI